MGKIDLTLPNEDTACVLPMSQDVVVELKGVGWTICRITGIAHEAIDLVGMPVRDAKAVIELEVLKYIEDQTIITDALKARRE